MISFFRSLFLSLLLSLSHSNLINNAIAISHLRSPIELQPSKLQKTRNERRTVRSISRRKKLNSKNTPLKKNSPQSPSTPTAPSRAHSAASTSS